MDKRPYIELPSVDDPKSIMRIDAASFKSLEVLKSNSLESSASLLSTINHTLTAAGSRLLSRWLQSPSTDTKLINSRLDRVHELIQERSLLLRLRELLQPCKDLERCYQRLALSRASGGPRDMQLIQTTLTESEEIRKLMSLHLENNPDSTLASLAMQLTEFADLIGELSNALNDKLPYRVADGGVIREGYSERLDMLRTGTGDVRKARSLLENRYRNETGKSTLRIDEGKLLGFFVEVSRSEGLISTENALFHFDGQTETKFRYRTTELNDLRDSSTVNEAKILMEESLVYERLREMVCLFFICYL
jgi:DNA mismatch repair protein MutS